MRLEQGSEGGRGHGPASALLLAGLVLAALILRFARLGYWGFDSDEIFMLRDSVYPRLTNPRPLLYLINHYFVLPVMPLDELGLRFLPAVFGVLAIPAFYWVSRRLLGTRPALFGTLLVTLSGLLVTYSQFGRYWSLVFLLSAVYPYAIYLGVRERDRRALVVGILAGLLASLAHPVSVLLAGGPLIWFLVTYLRPGYLKALWGQRMFRWGALFTLVLVAALAARFVPILQGWISSHDANPGSGQFLLRAPPLGVKQVLYLLAFVDGLTVPVALTGVLGIYLLWHSRDQLLARYLISLALFPIVFLTLISIRTPVSTYYLLPTAPVFFLGAGFFLDRMAAVDWKLRPHWMLPALITFLVLLPGLPTLVSQYLNGRRYDFKNVAQWLRPRLTPADVVFSDQPVALAHYLPGVDVQRLRYNTAPLSESVRMVQQSMGGASLWIVAPSPGHAFRPDLRAGGLVRWIYDNCQLSNSVGTGRVDFREQYLQVYRCPALSPGAAGGQLPPPVADSTSSS
jgi:hypothetical protein